MVSCVTAYAELPDTSGWQPSIPRSVEDPAGSTIEERAKLNGPVMNSE
jgi:hypothetical protein